MESDDPIDRRQFGSRFFAASTTALAVSLTNTASAADPPVQDDADDQPGDKRSDDERPVRDAPPAELLVLHWILQRYPSDRYDDDAMRGIFGDIRGDLARGQVLSAFPLANSDEPSHIFRAYRAPN